MQKLLVDETTKQFVHADIYIRSAYQYDVGWGLETNGNASREAFRSEVNQKIPFGDFTAWEGSKLVNTDKRQYIYCHPLMISYLGAQDGLVQLENNVRTNRFESFQYLKTGEVKSVCDITKDELESILDKNKEIIRANIKERVTQKPGSDKDRVIDDVFQVIRIYNTAERNYLLMSPQELSYKKTVSVFNEMVKNKEIILNRDEHVLPARKRNPLRQKKSAIHTKGVERDD